MPILVYNICFIVYTIRFSSTMKTRSGLTPRNRFSPYFRRKKASKTKEKKLTSHDKKQLDNISTSLNKKFDCVKADYAIGTLSDSSSSSDSEVDNDSNAQNRNVSQSPDNGDELSSITKSAKNTVIKDEPNSVYETSVPKYATNRTAKARKTAKQPVTKQVKRGRPLRNLRSKGKISSQELAEEKAVVDPKLSKDSRNQISSDMEYEEQLSHESSSSDDTFVIPKRKSSTKRKRKTGNRTNVKKTYGHSGSRGASGAKTKHSDAAATIAINTADDSDENELDNIVNGSEAVTSSSMMRDCANESDSDIEWEDVGHVCHEGLSILCN